MHSQLALTEHVSLNLAPLILLDPVQSFSAIVTGTMTMWNTFLGYQNEIKIKLLLSSFTIR